MKKNKTFITLALLIAVAILAVGYAAIGGINLEITGSASATTSDKNFKVKFVGTPTSDKTGVSANSTNVVVTPAITDDRNATLNVSGLTTKNDTVTATYTVKNESEDITATVAKGEITNTNATYFEVTSVIADSTLAPDATTTVTVTVKLIKTPVDGDVSTNITIPFTATPA